MNECVIQLSTADLRKHFLPSLKGNALFGPSRLRTSLKNLPRFPPAGPPRWVTKEAKKEEEQSRQPRWGGDNCGRERHVAAQLETQIQRKRTELDILGKVRRSSSRPSTTSQEYKERNENYERLLERLEQANQEIDQRRRDPANQSRTARHAQPERQRRCRRRRGWC